MQAITYAISRGLDKIAELRDALGNDWIDRNETIRLLNATRVRVERLKNLRKLLGQRAADRCNRRYGHVDCNGQLKDSMVETEAQIIERCVKVNKDGSMKANREIGNMDCQVRFLTARGLK